MLDLLETGILVSTEMLASYGLRTYNRLENNSMAVVTPNERATVPQMLENAVFFHSELGINAGLPSRTWR